jgi:hypothetical protein
LAFNDVGVAPIGLDGAAGELAGLVGVLLPIGEGFCGSGFLENIFCSLHVIYCVYWLPAKSYFIM